MRKTYCKHDYKEDPMFSDGIITVISGTPDDLGEETRVECTKCGDTQYVRMKDFGSIVDIAREVEDEQ